MSSSPVLTVPQTQNTAPVLEFRCLYTQDLRRKQKRWQDGRLKFHTFNKRVMVYDERSNFVGDAHWREDSDFNEGEELELERGGILVEVGECIGKKDQDLSELVDKRVKEKERRAATMAAAHSATWPRASLAGPQISTPASAQHQRPKPLNAVIGMPTGHYGRALVSNLSPFEQKHPSNQDNYINVRPAKRQKQNHTPTKSGYAQNLLGATLTLGSTHPSNTQTIRYDPLKTTICRPQTGTIDLTLNENDDGVEPWDTRNEGIQRKSLAKVQNRSSDRNPHSSCGYASNLTGATLALSRPAASTSANSAKKLSIPTKAAVSPCQAGNPNTSTYRAKRIAKPTTKLKPLENLEIPNQQLDSSTLTSEPSIVKSTGTPSTGHKHKPTQVTIAKRLIAERPVTALRIKPRPPRKMMMLMGLPRPPRPAPDMDAEGSKVPSATSKAMERVGIETIEGSNLSLSPDRGLNTDIHAPLQSISTMVGVGPVKALGTSRDKLDGSAIAHRQTTLLDARMLNGESTKTIPLTAIGNTIELERFGNSSSLQRTEALPQRENQPGEAFKAFLLQPRVIVGDNNHVETDNPNYRSKSASICSDFDAEDEPMTAGTDLGLTLNEGIASTVLGVPQHPNSDPVPSTNCCRQNPATSVGFDGKALLHTRATKEKEKSELALDRNSTPREMGNGTSEIVIKPSPASSTLAAIVDQVDYFGQTVEEPRVSIALPRGRLVNPAIPQSFVKAAASRVINSKVRGPKVLPGTTPPPFQTSVWTETTTIKEDIGLCDPTREAISRGPWSRESFDLFGTWRPPRRAANSTL